MNFSLRKGMITNEGREGHTYNKDYGNLSFYHHEGLIVFRNLQLLLIIYYCA